MIRAKHRKLQQGNKMLAFWHRVVKSKVVNLSGVS